MTDLHLSDCSRGFAGFPLMADGFNNREISIALNVVEGTIKNHVSSVLSKLGVRDRTRAVLRGLELAII